MNKKLRVGVIGVGGISGAHIPAWKAMEDVDLVCLCDIRPEQMNAFHDLRKYTNYEEMLANEQLDIVDICLPTYLHVDYALKAIEKGINVITEKPISLHSGDAIRVYEAAAAHHVHFMVAHCLRFWPAYCYIKKVYDSEKYGKLLSASMWRVGEIPEGSYDDWMLDEKRSGFIPYDLHIHDLDFLIYVFGLPKDYSVKRIKRPDQDYLSAVYDYDNFFITAESAWYKALYPFTYGFRFQFEEAVIANEHDVLSVYLPSGDVLCPLDTETDSDIHLNLPTTDAYTNELLYYKTCIKNGESPDIMNAAELESVIKILNSFPEVNY